MPRVGVMEMITLGRVIGRGQLLRYRGGEHGFTTQFEARLREKLDVKHVLTVNSGTSALIAALVGAGIGPGDEVLVPAYIRGWRRRSLRLPSARFRCSSTSMKV